MQWCKLPLGVKEEEVHKVKESDGETWAGGLTLKKPFTFGRVNCPLVPSRVSMGRGARGASL